MAGACALHLVELSTAPFYKLIAISSSPEGTVLLNEHIEPSTSVMKTKSFVLIKLGGAVNGFSIEDATEEQELIALTNAAIEKSVQEEDGATGG